METFSKVDALETCKGYCGHFHGLYCYLLYSRYHHSDIFGLSAGVARQNYPSSYQPVFGSDRRATNILPRPIEMKLIIFLSLAMAAFSTCAYSECRTSFDPHKDKVQDVRVIVKCLVDENAKLKENLSKQKATSPQNKEPPQNSEVYLFVSVFVTRFSNSKECQAYSLNYLEFNGFSNVREAAPAGALATKSPTKIQLFCTSAAQLVFAAAGPDLVQLRSVQNDFMTAFGRP
jgi:hypothetical protein